LIDREIFQNAENKLATRFERDLLVSSIENITKSVSPLRFNNFAYAIRELTRHILARLAPDSEVLNSKWYKNETEKENGISRRQRIYYAIHGGLLPTYIQETLGIDIQTFHKKFRDIIDRLSKYTHVEKETFGLDENTTYLYTNQTIEALVDLFDFIDETKETVSDALRENIEIALINSIIEQTFSHIDILATHHSLENVYTETLKLLKINHKFIYFEVDGIVEYRMQWGSNSDVKKGDGMVFLENFPFSCKLKCDVLNSHKIIVDIESIVINTDPDRGD